MTVGAAMERSKDLKRKPERQRETAESMAARQREISVSEFFAKNRHLLGFDNPRKALLTTVKEAVDNSLDACEEAGILPDLLVDIEQLKESGDTRYLVTVQDNGPGIVRKQIEGVFGSLLYGSKFHRLKMSRGQQGIGISAAGMYGLMTTGKPVWIISKTSRKKPAVEVRLKMDTSRNKAEVIDEGEHPEDDALFPDGHGTRVVIELEGRYLKGRASVDEYLELTAIANPHARIVYRTPNTREDGAREEFVYERAVDELPAETKEIKPHPHGIELGTLIQMLERTDSTQLGAFFKSEFSRVSPRVVQEICREAGVTDRTWIKQVGHSEAEKLYKAMQGAKIMAPPTDCLSPIGARVLLKGLEKGLTPDFIAVSSRPPAVYRGRPFLIEAGVAFGGSLPADEPAKVHRFANRVPLQYQQAACASFKAVLETDWRRYGMSQPKSGAPIGPLVVMVHMASVWVPFTSESKEAVADYDEIRKEMRLALQECGRKLGTYLRRRQRMRREGERRSVFERYIGEIARACERLSGADAEALRDRLLETARTKTAQADAVLDEEGRVVRSQRDSLAADDEVFIRDADDGEPESDADEATEPESDPQPGGAPSRARKKVKKKVRRKVRRKDGARPPEGEQGLFEDE